MATLQHTHTRVPTQKNADCFICTNADTHVHRLQRRRVLDTETASIDWKEDSNYSGGLREGRQERRRGRESMQGHGNTHMHTQAGMPRHLTPRHKHHCFALNIVPITDSYRDSERRRCYDESTRERERVRDRLKEWQ